MPSADQYAQALIEAAPNAEATPNAISTTQLWFPYQSFGLDADAVNDDRTDEFRGTAQPIVPDRSGFNQTSGSATGRLYPNGIGLPLFMLLGIPVTTAGNGVITDPDGATIPATVYRHVWDSSLLDPSLIRTAQMRMNWGNNSTLFYLNRGVTCTQLDLAIGDQAAPSTFAATLAGLYQARISDPSLTPSYDATTIKPLYRGNFAVSSWLAGTGVAIGMNLSFTNPVEPDPVLSSSLWPSNWSRPNEAGAVPRLTGTLNVKSVDPDDYDSFYNNTVFTYKQKWLSTQNILATSYKFQMWVEGAATYDSYPAGQMEHKLRHGVDIPWTAGASGATPAFKVTVVNSISSWSSVS